MLVIWPLINEEEKFKILKKLKTKILEKSEFIEKFLHNFIYFN